MFLERTMKIVGRLKDYMFDEDYEIKDESVQKPEPPDREYPVKQRIDGFPVTHYYDGENPIWEIYDDGGKLVSIAHSHEELHSITAKEEI